MTVKNRDDDLFKESTMTFGEHLGELRTCLFRAVLSLALGFTFGLLIGRWIVHVIQDPLVTALTEHQVERAVDPEARYQSAGIRRKC